jgi:hypothetical protein
MPFGSRYHAQLVIHVRPNSDSPLTLIGMHGGNGRP